MAAVGFCKASDQQRLSTEGKLYYVLIGSIYFTLLNCF